MLGSILNNRLLFSSDFAHAEVPLHQGNPHEVLLCGRSWRGERYLKARIRGQSDD